LKKKKETVVFSVRAAGDDVAEWKLYAQTACMTLTSMTTEAMTEYMQTHPLTGFKANIFNSRMRGLNSMTVREWIEEEAARALFAEEEQHGRHFSEDAKQEFINDFVNECVENWEGADDPLAEDPDTEYMRDRVTDYAEEWAEKTVEHLGTIEDERD